MSTRPNKREQILKAALQLFAKEGCETVSTKKIAAQARVSEGLIFKHFGNKQGLIEALYAQQLKGLERVCENLEQLSHPKVLLSEILALPFLIKEKHFHFYKWHINLTGHRIGYSNPLAPLVTPKLEVAFKALNVKNTAVEIATFWIIFSGFTQALILDPELHYISIYNSLKEKYNV